MTTGENRKVRCLQGYPEDFVKMVSAGSLRSKETQDILGGS